MSILSIGQINLNYLLYFLSFVLITISLNCISFFGLQNISKYNVSLIVITHYGCFILFIIPEIIINKHFRLKDFFHLEKKTNQIKYIFKDFSKRTSLKSIILDILAILFFVILVYVLMILQIVYDPTSKLIFTENYYFISFLFLYISTRILYTFEFYNHHKLSLGLIIMIGFIRYIIKIVVFHSPDLTFPFDYILLFCLVVIAFFEALLNAYIKLVIEIRYYSPLIIIFMIGLVCSCFAILILVFSRINCDNAFCKLINQSTNFNLATRDIIFLVLYSFCYGLYYFCLVMIIRNYSPCHIFLFFQSKEFITNIFYSINSWNTWLFILILVTFILDINASFVFLEMIELKFCGLDKNLKNKIGKRGENETKKLLKHLNDTDTNDSLSYDSLSSQ